MLAKKSDNCRDAKRNQNNYSPVNNPCGNFGLFIQGASITKCFPVSSDDQSSNSRITGGEIAWSNETIAHVATFWKMLGFSSISHKGSVARRCWCSPSSNSSVSSFKTQRVLGVNTRNCTPVKFVTSENVVDYHSSFSDLHARVPKKQPRNVAKPYVDPGFSKSQTNRVDGQSYYSEGRKSKAGYSHYSAGSRVQSSGIHFLSFTQNFQQEGPCC